MLVRHGTDTIIARRVQRALTPIQRAKGLLARPPLESDEALVFDPARQVHTAFMRYSIDVAFCDESWTVLHIVAALPPWRITRWVRGSRYAVEMGAGSPIATLRPGDELSLTDP